MRAVLLTVLAGLFIYNASAAPFRKMAGSTTGTGVVEASQPRINDQQINKIGFDFASNGAFFLRFTGRQTTTFSGTARMLNDKTAELFINNALNSVDAKGTGRANFRRRPDGELELHSVTIDGSLYGSPFKARFLMGAQAAPAPARFDSLTLRHWGWGWMHHEKRPTEIVNRLEIRLQPRGRAEIILFGKREHRYAGRWSHSGPREVKIELIGEGRRDRANGNIWLNASLRGMDSLYIGGNFDGRPFYVQFTTDPKRR